MTYEEMSVDEFIAITEGLLKRGVSWHDMYWSTAPAWWRLGAQVRFHMDKSNRLLRAACRKHGGFDPLWPISIYEF